MLSIFRSYVGRVTIYKCYICQLSGAPQGKSVGTVHTHRLSWGRGRAWGRLLPALVKSRRSGAAPTWLCWGRGRAWNWCPPAPHPWRESLQAPTAGALKLRKRIFLMSGVSAFQTAASAPALGLGVCTQVLLRAVSHFTTAFRVSWVRGSFVSKPDILGVHPLGAGPKRCGVWCGVRTLHSLGRSSRLVGPPRGWFTETGVVFWARLHLNFPYLLPGGSFLIWCKELFS